MAFRVSMSRRSSILTMASRSQSAFSFGLVALTIASPPSSIFFCYLRVDIRRFQLLRQFGYTVMFVLSHFNHRYPPKTAV
jgi:hypothetical protein